MKTPNRINPMRDSLHRLALVGSPARIAGSLAALALAATPVWAAEITVPNGSFEILYKPGQTTITADTGGGWTQGVGPNAAMETGQLATFSDSTTGPAVDIPGWINAPATGTPPDGGWAPPYGWPKGSGTVDRNGTKPDGLYRFSANGTTWGANGGAVQSAATLTTVATGLSYTISMSATDYLTGPVLDLLANGVIVTPASYSKVPDPRSAGWFRHTKIYSAASLTVGQALTIRAGWQVGASGGQANLDDVRLASATADTTVPTLASFEHNKGSGPVTINEPVAYTVTFSEPMYAATVDAADFANASATPITVDSVTPTANPAVFLVGVTPTATGTLQLQVVLGTTLTDLEGNLLDTDPAISDDSTLVVEDLPPTPTSITVVSSGSPTTYGQNVTFTATVSPTPSGGTVQFWYGANYLGTPVTVNTSTGEASITTTTLGATTHAITADYSGNFAFAASSTAASISQQVGKAPLTVTATNLVRPTNTANPDPLSYQITGYQNGENLATSGVTGTPLLTTTAVLSSPVGPYPITCNTDSMAAANYSFTPQNGTLTVAEMVNTFSVNFYTSAGPVQIPTGVPAGLGDWFTGGWLNYDVPWSPTSPQAPVTLTSNLGSSATFTLIDTRNGGVAPSDTSLGGNYSMMGAMAHGTNLGTEVEPHKFDMNMINIPFGTYDVIFYMGRSVDHGGDGTGAIVFNGAPERAFTVKSGAFDGTFTEMVDATTEGNYIVFTGVTGSSFTAQIYGNGFNHLGPAGFQIRRVPGPLYSTWADANNATGQTPEQDHDNDGVENGIEYFMGETGSSFTAMPGLDAANKVTWTMDPDFEGTYEVQTSPDLVTWTNVAPRPVPSGGTLSYTLPTGAPGGKSFVRLLVTPTL